MLYPLIPTLSHVALIAVAMTLAACGMTALQVRERDLCYSRAEIKAQDRVDSECDGAFKTCSAARDIMDELRRAEEACP